MREKYIVFVNEENLTKEQIDSFYAKLYEYHEEVVSYKLIESDCEKLNAPKCVIDAYKKGMHDYVCEYIGLKEIFKNGGLYLKANVKLKYNLTDLFNNHLICPADNNGNICSDFIGGDMGSLAIKRVLDSYESDVYKDQLSIDLGQRVYDVLRFEYGIVPEGKTRAYFDTFKLIQKDEIFAK